MTLLQKINPFSSSRPASRQSTTHTTRSSAEHTTRPSSSLEGGVSSEDGSSIDHQHQVQQQRQQHALYTIVDEHEQYQYQQSTTLNTYTEETTHPFAADNSNGRDQHPPRRDTTIPIPLPPSSSTPKHKKTPSILRSLAHHPSFSALKSKSRRKRSKVLSSNSSADAGAGYGALELSQVGAEGGREGEMSEKKLRASWSVPDGLRLSDERSRGELVFD